MTVDGRARLGNREIRNAVPVEVALRHAAAAPALWTLFVDPQCLAAWVRQLIAWIIAMGALGIRTAELPGGQWSEARHHT